jgi:sulfopyruvate decarboxylase TPP-binding subunit
MLYVGISDKVLSEWIKDKKYIGASDEGEAVAIGAGHYIQTGERATVFMSADGFCNALNALTSWIIPDEIEMDLVISTGRQEPPHKVMSDILPKLIAILPYDNKRISFTIIEKQS